ncbi:TRAP transporter substrate-binding protein [Natribacillus halophilus]|uniref:Tripartite ATP-independent transporter solute receptor, DctP family n=1 Tax=Natribacillus halophilus TaxID=549003 RepID=A0A1G8KEI4_9BACI|nr:TRAP transporter substrate-binding protein [Natribacillus halophilus]SDI41811.1 tripartite ATP-independent transporter solute receptor, DctP family [Natribacillus halophilus]
MIKNRWLLVLTVCIVGVLSACGNEESEGEADATEISFALDQPAEHIWVDAVNEFAELAEEKSDGSLDISVHDSASLGDQDEALEGMQVGTTGGTVSVEPVSSYVEEVGIYGVPYLFEDEEHLETFLESEHGEELDELMIDEGFRPLTYFMRDPRQMSSNQEINSLEDMSGLNIRVPESPTAPDAFEAMGASVVTMPIDEVYSALEQNVIDGQENPITQIHSDGFYEVQDHVTISNHQYQAGYLLISESIYQDLNEEEQVALEEAAEEAQLYESELLQEEIEEAYNDLEEAGVEISEPDTDEFADAAAEAYDGYSEVIQEWIERVEDVQ